MKLSTMKPFLFFSLLLGLGVFSPPVHADSLEDDSNYWLDWNCSIGVNSDYSMGYRAGTLNGTSDTVTSFEGYLKLGTTTTVITSKDALSGEETQVSPWKFSMSGAEKQQYLTLKNIRSGDPVYIGYIQYTSKLLSSNILSETDYNIIAANTTSSGETNAYFEKVKSVEAGEPFNIIGDKKEGYGLVIKASHKGYCFKTYEITMQFAENSDEVYDMSIQDFEVYRFALNALKSGRKVRFFYKKVDLWGRMMTFSKTNLIIYKIELF